MNNILKEKIIDCDVHHTFKHHSQLFPYLSKIWIDRINKSGFGYPTDYFTSSAGAKRLDANYKVILNVCPHAAAEVCKGIIRDLIFSNTVGEFLINENNQTLVCPWHRWEFDLNTGKSVVKSKLKIRIFETFVENENLYFKK